MKYTALIKYLRTGLIAEGPFFKTRKLANIWVNEQMEIWEEDRGYKIVEDME